MPEPSDLLRNLELHLQHWLGAYGSDFAIPPGTVAERPAAEATAAPTGLEDTVEPAATDQVAAFVDEAQPLVLAAPPEKKAEQPTAEQSTAVPAGGEAAATVAALRALRAEIHDCTKCKLHTSRQHTVFGEGSSEADVMFIGEAPGAREDASGRPFVGDAGQLLDRILQAAMGLERSEAFIANVNKCRPPGNRAPEPDEVAACLPYLKQQVELVQPKVLVCLGRTAAQNLLGSSDSIAKMRQQQHEYLGIPVVVTWHPAYLLREPSHKRETWDDIKRVNRLLGRPEVPTPKP